MDRVAARASVHAVVDRALMAGDLTPGASAQRLMEGVEGHRSLQSAAEEGVRCEVPVRCTAEGARVALTVYGRIDRLHEGRMVEEIKTTLRAAPADAEPAHWAQAECYAHMVCQAQDLPALNVRVTYLNLSDGLITRFTRTLTREALRERFLGYVQPYLAWLDGLTAHRQALAGQMRALRFPYPAYRAGQRELAGEIYLAIRDKRTVLAQAPTGTGKTMAALFPALKALGEGLCERFFYLTARTTARQAAFQALARLPGGELRAIELIAREKCCPQELPDCRPERCARAAGYFDRLPAALAAARACGGPFDRAAVQRLAERFRLCPFEFSLDLSLECDVIVCDYNYLFDPRVRLQRYASGGRRGQVLLVDEAHNLPDRARAMYSAQLSARDVDALRRAIPRGERKAGLYPALRELQRALTRAADEGGVPRAESALRSELTARCEEALCALDAFPAPDPRAAARLSLDLAGFLYHAQRFGEDHALLFEGGKSSRTVTLCCLDAAARTGEVLRRSRAAVLFSATLTPLPFYRALCGAPEGSPCVTLRSPFPPENLLVLHLPVSTRFRERERTLPRVASAVAALALSRSRGNFIAFFPSYAYLHKAAPLLEEALGGRAELLVQRADMDEPAREEFLARFSPQPEGRLVALCVLGGAFAEGIDLPADRLCGAAVVGLGLPQVGVEREALRRRYAEKYGDGYAYAYTYPGVGKVLQAAGRVIRSERDRGALLLIDDRYGRAEVRGLLPPEWSPVRVWSEAHVASACAAFFAAARAPVTPPADPDGAARP